MSKENKTIIKVKHIHIYPDPSEETFSIQEHEKELIMGVRDLEKDHPNPKFILIALPQEAGNEHIKKIQNRLINTAERALAEEIEGYTPKFRGVNKRSYNAVTGGWEEVLPGKNAYELIFDILHEVENPADANLICRAVTCGPLNALEALAVNTEENKEDEVKKLRSRQSYVHLCKLLGRVPVESVVDVSAV